MINLRYDLQDAYNNNIFDHAQTAMKKLRINYEKSIPQSLGDQWWFINCTNVPETLPNYLTIINESIK